MDPNILNFMLKFKRVTGLQNLFHLRDGVFDYR
jgi:hypothetical protein